MTDSAPGSHDGPQGQRFARDYVFDALRDLGIHYIFGVPGTNEIPIIDGTSYPENGVTYIECLHENIALGAAMGSARMTGLPGVVVVHVTPGIAHTIGNLFNAWRSKLPLVILCCQQQNELVTQEPLLASNLVDLARQYTRWAHEVRTPQEFGLVIQRAFKEAMAPPNGPVFVSIPWEFTMRAIPPDAKLPGITRIARNFAGDPVAVAEAAAALAAAKNPLIVLGDGVGSEDAWPEIQALAERIGAPVVLQTFSSVANFPNDDPHWQGELPGTQAGVQQIFASHDVAFLCGFACQAQITVFKYSSGALIPPGVRQIYLSNDSWDIGKNYFGETAILGGVKATLPAITARIAPSEAAKERNARLADLAAQRRKQWEQYLLQAKAQTEIWAVLIADALRHEIAERGLEKQFVYVHEAVSDPAPFQYLLPLGTQAAPISYYCVAGGSLGWSMPASLGIKLSGEGWQGIETQLVVNAVGDGSSLFYPQVWWTAAHRKLAILYIVTNNHEYHTLQLGLQQVVASYGSEPGYGWKPKTMDPEYLRLQRPKLDFVALAKALGGVDGRVVHDASEVAAAVHAGVEHVLTQGCSFVLDMRTAQNTPPTPPTADAGDTESAQPAPVALPTRYAAQPTLDVFHSALLREASTEEGPAPMRPSNVPVIF